MNQKELKELIEFIIEKDIAEFELERGDVKVRIRRAAASPALPAQAHVAPVALAAPVAGGAVQSAATHAATGPPRPPVEAEEAGLHVIPSPIVGTFYESPSPGSPPFVKAGDVVENGQVLCIIEA